MTIAPGGREQCGFTLAGPHTGNNRENGGLRKPITDQEDRRKAKIMSLLLNLIADLLSQHGHL
jgi:hypothetical protein